jgi:TPR repeat protein
MKVFLRCGFLALVVIALAFPANAGPFEDGAKAAERGDYTAALKLWRPLAELGHIEAQYILAVMYSTGQGVPQDDATAALWYRKAAEQGFAKAQYSLGLWHTTGRAIPQNFVSAHMWFTLAAVQGDEKAQKGRALVTRLMTPAQIATAQRLAGEWMVKHQQ